MNLARSPTSVKDLISKSMALDKGNVFVLICTVAFGFRVNCKVRRVIHFGPSKSVELYVQECGRADRYGLLSSCALLYNGLLSSHCDADMKEYLQIEQCHRRWPMEKFGSKKVLVVQTRMERLITVAIFVLVDANVVVRAVVGFGAPVKTDPVYLSSEQVLLVTVTALKLCNCNATRQRNLKEEAS